MFDCIRTPQGYVCILRVVVLPVNDLCARATYFSRLPEMVGMHRLKTDFAGRKVRDGFGLNFVCGHLRAFRTMDVPTLQLFHPLSKGAVRTNQYMSLQVMANLFFDGIQITLSTATLVALARNPGKKRLLRMAVIAVMFALLVDSAITILVFVVKLHVTLSTNHHHLTVEGLTGLKIVGDLMRKTVLFICDIIVVWRAWIMYPESCKVRILLVVCTLGCLGGLAVHSVFIDGPDRIYRPSVAALVPVCTLLTNIVATALVSRRLWTYRRNISRVLRAGKGASKIDMVLTLLVESSAVYCIAWVCMAHLNSYIAWLLRCTQGPLAFVVFMNGKDKNAVTVYSIIGTSYPYLAGIYITFVILALERLKNSEVSIDLSALVSHDLRCTSPRSVDSESPGAHEQTGLLAAPSIRSRPDVDCSCDVEYGCESPWGEEHVVY
ncbi:uncharacterized protein SCHCODRAFT_02580081 [Schizophyllum commune H4-8]|nr:uncharacterized protein SCHCODRAFT_02580081 [Schizophyllum commune H4-8]KAI5890963.1 hypothetical protein SCHCODRAFT_02580081 [Schizophyllum commune H4-8]